jgi:hypothetical protein
VAATGVVAAGLLAGLAVVSPAAEAHPLCSKTADKKIPGGGTIDIWWFVQVCVYESKGGYITAKVDAYYQFNKRKLPKTVKLGLWVYPTLGSSKGNECDKTKAVRADLRSKLQSSVYSCSVKMKKTKKVSYYSRGYISYAVSNHSYWLFTNNSPKHA